MMDAKKENEASHGFHFQSDPDGISAALLRKRPRSIKARSLLDGRISEDGVGKRPRLTVDTSRDCQPLCEALSSNESFTSTFIENDFECVSHHHVDLEGVSNQPPSGLSAYLEDIDSDEELDEIETTPSTSEHCEKPRGKDDLLSMMDKVDRDIASIEQRILSLEKRQKELLEVAETSSSADNDPSVTMVTPPPSDQYCRDLGDDHQRSLVDVIYSDNKLKARNSHSVINGVGIDSRYLGVMPMYYQPSEAPAYWRNVQRHVQFRPDLLKCLKARKLSNYKKEYSLCEEYDQLMEDWGRKVDKWEKSQKKRSRDAKNKDMFEKVFPEVRSKSVQLRDQAERFSRAGMRAFGVVRSEAELNELAYELFEQEEAKGRHHRTHAVIPSMILDSHEKSIKFINNNGLLRDPMALYRETKSTSLWTDGEKATFREKFALFPKNFEKISSFIPNKTINDCVRYYYLAKKNGNFKSLSRRSVFKRRRHHLPKTHDYSLSSPLLLEQSKSKHFPQTEGDSMTTPIKLISPTNKEPVIWSEEEIARLKDGLQMYGRAWGKVYREVGGYKTATQCKQFYDDYCTDPYLDLNSALAEHSAKKNAERVEKKMAEIKKMSSTQPTSAKVKNDQEEEDNESESASSEGETSDHMSSQEEEEERESDSETTITDSGQEEQEEAATHLKPKLHPLNLCGDSLDSDPIQSPLDIFLSAAEALSNTVPSEVALHDHTYSCPPLDIQGGSGLQLIAAAAAVVSPGLSKTTWNNSSKSPLSHTVKAPRGRPPSTQKKGTTSSQKIGPSFLTPTSGASQNVLLQEIKPTLRGRSRSAPTEKPRPTITQKSPTITSPLLLKGGAKLFTTNQPSRGGTTPLTYSRSKDGNVVSLKTSSNGATTVLNSNSGNSLDALVSVAASASPAELPKHQVPNSYLSNKAMTNRTKDNTNNNNPVLELNLGNMALLLAATGNNQQTALLLPQSSLLNKHTLAVLQGGQVCLSEAGGSLTIDTMPSFSGVKNSLTSTTISIDFSRASHDTIAHASSIPLVTPSKNTTGNKQTLTLSLASTPKIKSVHLPKTTALTTVINSAPVTPVTTPTTDDLSNLNLLSNLVAGMTKKSCSDSSAVPPPSTKTNAPVNSTITTSTVPSTINNVAKPVKPVSHHSNTNDSTWIKAVEPRKPVTTDSFSSAQQSLMLYTRSLPLNSAAESSPEEEDHLEYATRGIDELTRLLGGTDNGLDNEQTVSSSDSRKRAVPLWSPDELLCNPFNNQASSIPKCISSSSLVTVTSSYSTSSSSNDRFNHTHSSSATVVTQLSSNSSS